MESRRRSAPQRVEAWFAAPFDPSPFTALAGVRVLCAEAGHLVLGVSGGIAPVLREIAALEPLDLLARHADLDELFLDLYRGSEKAGDDAD